jgi:type IV pilus assembly protein PilB
MLTVQPLQGLAALLVKAQLLTQAEVHCYQDLALKTEQSLAFYLAINDIIPAEMLAQYTAKHFRRPLLTLDAVEFSLLPTGLLHEKLMVAHQIIPLHIQEDFLFLATEDPSQHSLWQEIQFLTGLHVFPIVVESTLLHLYIDKFAHKSACYHLSLPEKEDILSTEEAPIVKFINQVLIDAVKKGASDIHFEPFSERYRIRYRLDGLLKEVTSPPLQAANRLASRLKIMANLDIAEHRLPQDGRFKLEIETKTVDFRVSVCPTTHGEKIALRILDQEKMILDIISLGLNSVQTEQFL